ncbi:MAG: flavodoxin-dependent (E)-4-hydroxy-3-methylbut-2-enyl-diphosphate synthase [Candidatus Omnitrophica bacterium]|nr:flavodoxin-dependent (E)-4-hydroxy-3-methylbut-2-enyl-diphosphate synthase [Candidatus Omnitrophota bacterium]MDD5351865.1 flavodoxin-dependent (E)-4-hydroxy-3-methylbut-2-enyl-diphosphate synthase [Candidatus Omnitrophota bacterium]MDD5550691.1 flavodoxin-dependent (E)-4-hydroxy-3-methylbut-2-enyl-diphosphate synthase [Candidatus Omnitrophota bacterium]
MAHEIKRRKTRVIKIGNTYIGGSHPILIQSMVKVPTKNVKKVLKQISELEKAGCEIIRVAVKDEEDAQALYKIKKQIGIPLVADIHFNYKFALKAIDSDVDKIRLNPGNIFKNNEVKEIAKKAKERNIPIRVGTNSGSLRDSYLKLKDTELALVRQTQDSIKMLEDFGIKNIVISLKSSDMLETIGAYRKISRLYDYPLHLGVTATGMSGQGMVKSSLGIGVLLLEGIGDTIRVSLLENPLQEIKIAKDILVSLGIRRFGADYICCPTCGRCEVDLRKKAQELTLKLNKLNHGNTDNLTIALMGCMVNGPGEAKHADIGIAFGKTKGILFKKGRIINTIAQDSCINVLIREIKNKAHMQSV